MRTVVLRPVHRQRDVHFDGRVQVGRWVSRAYAKPFTVEPCARVQGLRSSCGHVHRHRVGCSCRLNRGKWCRRPGVRLPRCFAAMIWCKHETRLDCTLIVSSRTSEPPPPPGRCSVVNSRVYLFRHLAAAMGDREAFDVWRQRWRQLCSFAEPGEDQDDLNEASWQTKDSSPGDAPGCLEGAGAEGEQPWRST